MPIENGSIDRNRTVDFLKGIGILFVLITHFDWTYQERRSMLFPFWIDMAVPIFMIVSGYICACKFERNHISTLNECYSYRYIIRRIINYTIPFMLTFFVEIMLFWIINSQTPGVVSLGIVDSDRKLVSLLKLFLSGGNGPGSYYYPLLIQFIFVFPFVYMITKKRVCGGERRNGNVF